MDKANSVEETQRVDSVGSFGLRAGRQRVDGLLDVDSIAGLVELVADLVVVVHGSGADDFDEPSPCIVGVGDSLGRQGSRADQSESKCGKSESGGARHDVPPLKAQMFRKLALYASSFDDANSWWTNVAARSPAPADPANTRMTKIFDSLRMELTSRWSPRSGLGSFLRIDANLRESAA